VNLKLKIHVYGFLSKTICFSETLLQKPQTQNTKSQSAQLKQTLITVTANTHTQEELLLMNDRNNISLVVIREI